MSEPRVTVITPLYNAEKFIERTIASIQAQTSGDWELLVINDGSSDGGPALVEKLAAGDKRIRMLHTGGRFGPGRTRNEGIKEARGKYIAFLDSDDLWLPEKLETQIGRMEAEGLDFSFTAYRKIDAEDKIISDVIPVPERATLKSLLKTNYIGTLTAVFNRESLGRMTMNHFSLQEDYSLWLNILKKTDRVAAIQDALSLYRVHADSISRNKFRSVKFQWKIYREHMGLGLGLSVWYLVHYAYYGYRKFRR